jgi:rhamnogalacturonan acetylesterase
MLYSQVVSVFALAATALAAPSADISKRAQTVYLAGDSTMAKGSGAITGTLPITSAY